MSSVLPKDGASEFQVGSLRRLSILDPKVARGEVYSIGAVKTSERLYVYTDEVLKRKPTLQSGQDLRTLATYTIPEAASFLAIPERTMQAWFVGRRNLFYPSMTIGRAALLSFSDVSEAYIVQVLRRVHKFSVAALRASLERAKEETGSDHPLLGHDILIFAKKLILASGRGRSRRMLDLTTGRGTQSAMPGVVDALGKRISFDKELMPTQLRPWRYLGRDQNSTPVSMQPEVMSGRLVITGTRIPVSLLAGIRREGKSVQFIADDYGLPVKVVQQALDHFDTQAA